MNARALFDLICERRGAWWLLPNGKWQSVELEHTEVFPSLLGLTPEEVRRKGTAHDLYKRAFAKGWVRVITGDGGSSLYYEGNPSVSQTRELKNTAIEKGMNLRYDGSRAA